MSRMIRCLAACAAVALLAVSAGASAQQPTQPDNSFTFGTTHTSVFNDIFQTVRQDTYLTRIVGRVDGGPVVYDMSFAAAFGTPLVDAAVAAAQVALNAALFPATTILGPSLTSSAVTLEGTITDLISTILTDTTSIPRTIVTFGPALIFTGEDLLTPYLIGDDETNFNTIIDFTLFYDRTYVTTETYLTSQTYELVGYPREVAASVPEPASLALLGLGVFGLAVRRQRARILACALALLAFAPATGWAQGTDPTISNTFGTTHTNVFNDIFQTAHQDTYLTRIVGRIDGGPVVYDMSFAQAFGNPAIDAAVAAAQAALNAALSPAPTILGPTLTASTVTLESSVMELVSTILTDTTSSPRVLITFGPALIFTGEDLLTPYQVGDNETNFNTIIDFTLFYDRTYETTETYLTSQTYELVGYARQVAAGVPEPASLALLGLGVFGLAVRRQRARVRSLALAFGVALLAFAPATGWAQGGGSSSFTTSTTHVDIFNDIVQTARQDTFLTRITARIDGAAVLLFDQSVDRAFGDSGVDAAIAAAVAALNAALSPPPTIIGPTLVSSDIAEGTPATILASQALADTIATEEAAVVTFGPDVIFIGTDKTVPYVLIDGETNFNTNTHYQYFYDRTYVTTTPYLTTQWYELVAYPQHVAAGVPEPASLALLGLGLVGLAMRRQRARILACALALLAFAPAAGWAQSQNQTFTESTTHTDNFNDLFQTARQDNFLTRIVARVDGGATVYDQSFNQAYGNPLIDAAIAAAQAALNAALSPAPTILGPTLVFSDVSLVGSVTDLVGTILANTIVTQTFTTTFGPADILIGPDKSVPYHVEDAIENFNTNTDTQFFYDRTYLTTTTYLTSQTYELVGYPRQIVAGVPEPASLALLALGLALAARRRRLRP